MSWVCKEIPKSLKDKNTSFLEILLKPSYEGILRNVFPKFRTVSKPFLLR